MRRGIRAVLVGAWWVAGCGGATGPGAEGETSGSSGGSTSAASSSGSTSRGDSTTGGVTDEGTTESSGAPTTSSGATETGASSGDSTGAVDACSFVDPDTGLCWQEPPAPELMMWDAAKVYCEQLDLRLPTVQELASLSRGCATSVCPVEDPACLAPSCRAGQECLGCMELGGPGPGGCYWDPALTGPCDWYWTASGVEGAPYDAWFIYFQVGSVDWGAQSIPKQVRCVRADP